MDLKICLVQKNILFKKILFFSIMHVDIIYKQRKSGNNILLKKSVNCQGEKESFIVLVYMYVFFHYFQESLAFVMARLQAILIGGNVKSQKIQN